MNKRAAIYTRVSTEDQDCQRQISDLQAFAQRAGYELVCEFSEKASGSKNDRKERARVIELAQQRKIDVILVTELTRWGRSTEDLLHTLQQLSAWNVSVIAEHGWHFDMTTPQGKLMVTVLAGVAEFERGMIRERVKSGIAAAKAAGKKLGRQVGECPSDKHAKKVLQYLADGRSVRWIAHEMQISKTTVMAIKKRHSCPAEAV